LALRAAGLAGVAAYLAAGAPTPSGIGGFEALWVVVIALAGVGLFVMLTIGGFSMLLSGGDPKKLEKARGTLTNAIIGIVIIVTAYLIIRTIGLFTGITNLDVFQVILR